MISVSDSEKRILTIATVLAVIVGVYFLKYYLMLIIFASIVAFMFNPLYQRLIKRGKQPASAASLTLLASFFALIIPAIIVISVTVYQVAGLASAVTHVGQNTDLNQLAQNTIDAINNAIRSFGINYQLELSSITEALSNSIKSFGSSFASGLLSSISGIAAFITVAIIYMYVFMSILKHQQKLLKTFYQLNPLGKDISALYISRTSVMTKAMVRGQFIIAACQGTVDALLLYLGGIHTGFFFFLLLLIALSIIPLGGGIVVLPIGFVMLLTGHIWQGALVILGHLLIVTNIDNIMRPKLVPKEARLDPALTMLAVFSGLKFFGFLGIIIGPVLMILLVTTIQLFLEVYKGGDEVMVSDGSTSKHRWPKVPFIGKNSKKART